MSGVGFMNLPPLVCWKQHGGRGQILVFYCRHGAETKKVGRKDFSSGGKKFFICRVKREASGACGANRLTVCLLRSVSGPERVPVAFSDAYGCNRFYHFLFCLSAFMA